MYRKPIKQLLSENEQYFRKKAQEDEEKRRQTAERAKKKLTTGLGEDRETIIKKYNLNPLEYNALRKFFFEKDKNITQFLEEGMIKLNKDGRVYCLAGGEYTEENGYERKFFGLYFNSSGNAEYGDTLSEFRDLEYLIIDEYYQGSPESFGSNVDFIRDNKKLKVFYVINDSISRVNDSIGDLKQLEDVDFSNNPLVYLSKAIIELPKLKRINLSNTPLAKDPKLKEEYAPLFKKLEKKGVKIIKDDGGETSESKIEAASIEVVDNFLKDSESKIDTAGIEVANEYKKKPPKRKLSIWRGLGTLLTIGAIVTTGYLLLRPKHTVPVVPQENAQDTIKKYVPVPEIIPPTNITGNKYGKNKGSIPIKSNIPKSPAPKIGVGKENAYEEDNTIHQSITIENKINDTININFGETINNVINIRLDWDSNGKPVITFDNGNKSLEDSIKTDSIKTP